MGKRLTRNDTLKDIEIQFANLYSYRTAVKRCRYYKDKSELIYVKHCEKLHISADLEKLSEYVPEEDDQSEVNSKE